MTLTREHLASAYRLYVQGRSIADTAQELGVPAVLLERLLIRRGFDIASSEQEAATLPVAPPDDAEARHAAPASPSEPRRDSISPGKATPESRTAEMYERYAAGASLREVGDAYGISHARVRQLFKESGFEMRGRGRPPGRVKQSVLTSPPWSRDELILALELYTRRGNLNDRDPEGVALSNELRAASTRDGVPGNFRSPASVNRKLGNFAALDPDFSGTGLPAGGALDAEIFLAYHSQPSALRGAADAIRQRSDPAVPIVETAEDKAPYWETIVALLADLASDRRVIRTVSGRPNRILDYRPGESVLVATEHGTDLVQESDIRTCWTTLVSRGRAELADLLEPGHRSAFMAALFSQLEAVHVEKGTRTALVIRSVEP